MVESPADYERSSEGFYLLGKKRTVPITTYLELQDIDLTILWCRKVSEGGLSAGTKNNVFSGWRYNFAAILLNLSSGLYDNGCC